MLAVLTNDSFFRAKRSVSFPPEAAAVEAIEAARPKCFGCEAVFSKDATQVSTNTRSNTNKSRHAF